MAERKPLEGESEPPPIVPPPLGFTGLGDVYSRPASPPLGGYAFGDQIIPPLASWPAAPRQVRGIGVVLDVLGKLFIPDKEQLEARANIVPKALSGEPLNEAEQSAFLATLPFAGVKKIGGTPKKVVGGAPKAAEVIAGAGPEAAATNEQLAARQLSELRASG